jgi:hypothetical protein
MGWGYGVGVPMDVGEDIFAGSGIVGLNFDPISPETHSDLGCTISLMRERFLQRLFMYPST